jgi:CHAT domain-containing protein
MKIFIPETCLKSLLIGDDWLGVPPDVTNELSAFGLDFPPGNPHGLPPLENASQEAESIARLFDGQAFTNDQATESRFLDLVQSSRYVHVATAECFFLSLYGRIREGEDIFAAFQHAQLATLDEYPNYRDWGAFYLIGA